MHIHLVLSLLCAFVLLNPFPHNIGIDDTRNILLLFVPSVNSLLLGVVPPGRAGVEADVALRIRKRVDPLASP